jgi:hypothetical protein
MANKSNVVNQHTTPKFYLKGFADPNEPAFIWQYNRGRAFNPGHRGDRHNPVKRSLRKAGVIPNYYPDIEDELTAFEEAGRPIIEKIRKATSATTGAVITITEKNEFVDYIGNLHKRVTKREKRVKPLWEKVVREFQWDQMQRDLANRGRFADALKLDQMRTIFTQGMPDQVRQKSILIPYNLLAAKLRGMTWRFLVATAPDTFVTSDDPVYIGTTSIFAPLAAHVALLAEMSGPDDCTVHPISAAALEQCNGVTIGLADDHLYSNLPSQWVADTFNRT